MLGSKLFCLQQEYLIGVYSSALYDRRHFPLFCQYFIWVLRHRPLFCQYIIWVVSHAPAMIYEGVTRSNKRTNDGVPSSGGKSNHMYSTKQVNLIFIHLSGLLFPPSCLLKPMKTMCNVQCASQHLHQPCSRMLILLCYISNSASSSESFWRKITNYVSNGKYCPWVFADWVNDWNYF